MQYCSHCNAALAGRFCNACGRESAPSGAMIEVPYSVGATAGALQPAPACPPHATPGYVAPVAGVPVQSMGSTADNRFTHDAEFLLRSTGERIAWQGKPSIMSLLPRALGWASAILLAALFAFTLRHGFGWILIWVLLAAIHLGTGYLNWRHTTYRITSQRLEYSCGVFSATTAASPVAEIGNVTIIRPFPWNFLGLGHLELDIPDQAAFPRNGAALPNVRLRYLPNLEQTRDLIHSSSTIFNQLWDRQRYGA
jgi:hypothetical protein